MAEEKTAEVAEDGANDIMEQLRSHSSIVIDDGEGNEYTLRYPRSLVKRMEAKGVTSQSVADKMSGGTLTGVEEFVKTFVMPAFVTDQPKITFDMVIGIFEQLPDKQQFIKLLMGLFMQPTIALTTDPTETRMKFRLV